MSAGCLGGSAFLDRLLMLPVPSSEHSTKGWEQGLGNSRLWPGAAPRPLQFNWGGKAEPAEGSEVCVGNSGGDPGHERGPRGWRECSMVWDGPGGLKSLSWGSSFPICPGTRAGLCLDCLMIRFSRKAGSAPAPLLQIRSLCVWSGAGNLALYCLSDLPSPPQFCLGAGMLGV